ncbi:hypothetical protein [Nitrospirillum pindoramense]|uniref:Cell wall polymerase n=1 Tax=Nitrospirillum amazonense TaxID=28077 RepID=A0A560HDQ3_9PROT|nr:hypothetical protein [Nitrospirillum amazonense]TWB44518.1 hypothetical protein FBZ90_103426 [Nitrospirillum amazonense]
MIGGLWRGLAILVCDILKRALPAHLKDWGSAIRLETAGIESAAAALRFAAGGLCGLLPLILAHHMRRMVRSSGRASPSAGMTFHPRAVGIACAIGAVGLGLGYLAMAGAPGRYLGVNAGALVLGLCGLAAIRQAGATVRLRPGTMTLLLSVLLLATAVGGARVDDAARWVNLAGLFIQPSLVLLPLMILDFARSPNRRSTWGMILTAAALALQPDRAMAGMLAVGLAILAMRRPDDGHVSRALAGAIAGFATTLIQPDRLAATPYVERVFQSAFSLHPIAGMLVLAGAALLLVPAMVGGAHDQDNQDIHAVFAALWLVALVAAALGNYPTPIVGYGGSAVIGYVLSLAMLPKAAHARFLGTETLGAGNTTDATEHRLGCVALA